MEEFFHGVQIVELNAERVSKNPLSPNGSLGCLTSHTKAGHWILNTNS